MPPVRIPITYTAVALQPANGPFRLRGAWELQAADRRVGGLNHFVLPKGGPSSRYGDTAMLELLEAVLDLGAHLRSLEAKVFGGAAVLPVGGERTVGAANVAFALGELARRGIPVAGRRTGGERGRHLIFHTGTGEAFVRGLAEHEKLPKVS